MIHTLKKYLALIRLVLKHGQWQHSGENFNQSRNENLVGLENFVPSTYTQSRRGASPFFKNAFIRTLLSQFSFIRKSFRYVGGHLSVVNLSYIRIPKSANTSISKTILEKIYPALKQRIISEKQINFLTDVNLQTRLANSENPAFFTIVRNPLSRLVSVYRSFFENNSADYIYRDYLFGILPQHLSFSDFVERISSIPDHLKDQHIKPQHCFLKYYDQKKIESTIFRLEDVEKLEVFLNQNNLQLLTLNKSEEPYDYRSYYNRKSLTIACDIYQKDIERFGYAVEIEALNEHVNTVHK